LFKYEIQVVITVTRLLPHLVELRGNTDKRGYISHKFESKKCKGSPLATGRALIVLIGKELHSHD